MSQSLMRRYLAKITALTCLTVAILGCQRHEASTTEAVNQLRTAIAAAQQKLADLTPNRDDLSTATSREIEKLVAVEYRVVVLDGGIESGELERKLNELGKDRWECFAGGATPPGGLRFICRRWPLSYLKVIAQMAQIM